MRKKVLERVIVSALIAGLMLETTACGTTPEQVIVSEDDTTTTEEPEQEEVTEESEEPVQEEVEEVIEEPEEEIEETIESPIVQIVDDWDYIYSEDNNLTLAEIQLQHLKVISDGFDELKSTLDSEANNDNEFLSVFTESVEEFAAPEYLDEFSMATLPWYYTVNKTVDRCDTRILSTHTGVSTYLGGPHPNTNYGSATYDVVSGKRLILNDVITGQEEFLDALFAGIGELEYVDELYPGWNTTIEDMLSAAESDDPLVWFMTNESLMVVFDAYVLSYYALGPVWVEIPYADYPELFVTDYLPMEQTKVCFNLDTSMYGEEGCYFNLDVDRDGEDEEIQIYTDCIYDDEYGYLIEVYPVVTITKGSSERSLRLNPALYVGDTTVCEGPDGDFYMYINYISENDWNSLDIVNISDVNHGPRDMGFNDSGAFYGFQPTDPDHMVVQNRLYVMGTFTGYKVCHIGKYGQLVSDDDEYRIMQYFEPPFSFEALQDFKAYTYKTRELKSKRVYVTVPAGTELIPYSTDGETYMTCMLQDGSFVDIYYDEEPLETWDKYIDGMPEEEVLDPILYAG